MNIDEMEAGRELDALIAERIFGLRVEWEQEYLGETIPSSKQLADQYDENGILPMYSTDIAAAWGVIEKLAIHMIQFRLEQTGSGITFAKFFDCTIDMQKVIGGAHADTAPLAICRAALKAVSP